MGLKDAILATPFVRERRAVLVPQWPGTDGKLFVRNVTALEYEQYSAMVRRSREDPSVCLGAEVAAFVVVDENGKPVFDRPEEDAKQLAAGAKEPLDVVYSVFVELLNAGGDASKKSGTAG